MGQLKQIRCKNCGEKWELRLGYGLRHGQIDALVPLFPASSIQRLPLEELRQFDEPWAFSFEPASCPICRSMVTVPVLRLTKKGETFTGTCSVCGSAADPLTEDELRRIDEALR